MKLVPKKYIEANSNSKTVCNKPEFNICNLLEKMFVWKAIYSRATSLEVFNIIKHFLEENEINWEN
jgi:hypothetical protein